MEQGTQNQTYLALLEDSLAKKCELLTVLMELTKEQELLFDKEKMDEEQFNRIVNDKDGQIQMLLKLDEGFEQIFQHVKDELSLHSGRYQDEISRLKSLITKITDESVQLQVMEKRNSLKIEDFFRTKRKEIKNFKASNQLVSSYYKNMTDHGSQNSYFLDQKQ